MGTPGRLVNPHRPSSTGGDCLVLTVDARPEPADRARQRHGQRGRLVGVWRQWLTQLNRRMTSVLGCRWLVGKSR
jgi:hypothetical protein